MTDREIRKKGRAVLDEGVVLRLSTSPDGSDAREYRIISYFDAGGSSVCYKAEELNTSRDGFLKEFYPAGDTYSFIRKNNNVLTAANLTKQDFMEMKADYTAPYRLLRETGPYNKTRELLKNYVQDSVVLYDADGSDLSTVYVWTTGFAGEKPDEYFDDLTKDTHISEKQKLVGILSVIRSVTSGLTAIHSNGFMHLDVKPSNILIHYDGSGKPNPANISFFDIDCFYPFGERVPRGLGTDGYRAPELMRGKADHRSDLYSVGAMLFTAITGTAYSPDLFDDISEILREAPLIKSMISNSSDSIIVNLSEILHKCLAHSPDDRYLGCSRLNDDIFRLIGLCSRRDPAARARPSRHECLEPNAVIQKLLYKHPLYACLPPDKKSIDVTVIGSDQFAALLADNALQSGQMKDRTINVRVMCEDPVRTKKEYLSLRPSLPRFVATDPEQDTEGLYGSIRFEALPSGLTFGSGIKNETANRILAADIIENNTPDYVFISLDTTAKSRAAAGAIDYVLRSKELVCPVCYVNDGTPPSRPRNNNNGPIPVYILEDVSAESFHPTLNRMAFNTNLSWGGAVNTEIRSDFDKFITDPDKKYDYRSSVSFVLSIKYKLFSCGILLRDDTAYPELMSDAGFTLVGSEDEAARVFSSKILQRGDTDEDAARTLRSLIALEHKRWVLEKVCQGWRGLDPDRLSYDIDNLTSGSSERGKIYDKEKKIHHCIAFGSEDMPLSAPEYSSGDRSLWESSAPEEFDELDSVSLLLHRHYMAEVKRIGARSPDGDIGELSAMISDGDDEVRIALDRFLMCLSGLSTGVSGYAKQYKRLKDRLMNTLPGGAVKNRADQLIKNIDRFYFPFIQAHSYIDFKSLDSALINDIPFILTFRFCDELVMPFSDGRKENFRNQVCFSNAASPTVLCPHSIRYLYHCEDDCQPEEVRIKLDALLKYFSRRNINCAVTFTIICREGMTCGDRLLEAVKSLKTAPCGVSAYLKTAELLHYGDIREVPEKISGCFEDGRNVLFDGTAPLFSSCAQNSRLICAMHDRGIAYFEFDAADKSFVNTSLCDYLAYVNDNSYITVSDMFSLMNASDIDFEIPEFLHDYRKLWDIYSGKTLLSSTRCDPDKAFEYRVLNWTKLCAILNEYFERTDASDRIVLKADVPYAMTERRAFTVSADMEGSARELLARLKAHRVIDPRSAITRQTSDTISVDIICSPSFSGNTNTLCRWLNEYKKPVVRYRDFTREIVISPESLKVEGVALSRAGDDAGVYSIQILKELQNAGYIRDLAVNDDDHMASFSFTSRRIKKLLTTAGEIVEIYVYCEALKTGFFDDIRKGFEFSWYGNRVENELDIVLTKGFSSMIVEVKAVEKLEMKFYHKLHSLASQFGINTKMTIVNNDYRNNSYFEANNELQSERGDKLHIKTFSGRQEIKCIGEELVRYMKGL